MKNPYIDCSKPLRNNQQALMCDFCDRWIHRRCTNPMIFELEYDRLGQFSDHFFCAYRFPVLLDSFFIEMFEPSFLGEITFETTLVEYERLSSSSCLPSPVNDLEKFASLDESRGDEQGEMLRGRTRVSEPHDTIAHDVNNEDGGSHSVFKNWETYE